MPRYYFNIRNGCGFTPDEEGVELSSAGDVRAQAIRGARSLISAGVLEGLLDLDGRIEVIDECDDEVLTLRFRDAVDIHHDDPFGAANR
ncbi:MAG TPA: hypothetical protein VMN38_11515 [Sphingomicrobium sp.]|nr:hypothetical protein [Sphingomicrobium sp.]